MDSETVVKGIAQALNTKTAAKTAEKVMDHLFRAKPDKNPDAVITEPPNAGQLAKIVLFRPTQGQESTIFFDNHPLIKFQGLQWWATWIRPGNHVFRSDADAHVNHNFLAGVTYFLMLDYHWFTGNMQVAISDDATWRKKYKDLKIVKAKQMTAG
jgi:hypothetical protein